MASAGTTAAAMLFFFSFSVVVVFFFFFQATPPGLAADLLASAMDRFLDGRGVLELATRRNMILLCHAILLLILRDAGVLGTLASRRSAEGVVVAQTACSAVPAPAARPHATRTSAVVWRRLPRNRAAAPMYDAAAHAAAARRLVECPQPAAEAAATWAAPVLTTGPPQAEEATAVANKQIVVVEPPRNDDDGMLDRHDRAATDEQLEHPTAIAADGQRDCDDRRIVVADDEKRTDDQTAGMGTEMEMELADDRTFEEFIESQRRQMRQESLQLVRQVSSDYHYHHQAIATCY